MSESQQASQAGPGRGSLGLLLDPFFGRFLAARLLSTAGVWIYNIVAAILVYEISGSTLMVGMVSVAQFGPQLLLAPLSGALADRGDLRRQLMFGRFLVAFGSGSLAIWLGIVGAEGLPGAWPVMAAAFVVGLGFVLTAPAQESLIPALVRRNELAPAVALNAIPPTLARTLGPALGALVAASIGPAVAFAIAAVANLLFVLVIWSINVESRSANGEGADRSVRAGIRYLSSDRGLLLLLGGVVAIGMGTDPAITLTPPLAESFGRGAGTVGLFASAFGIGSLSVFAMLGRLRRRIGLERLASTGLVMLAGGLLAAGNVPVLWMAAASFVVSGAGMTMGFTSITTQMQQRLPDDLRGRIMAFWAMAFLGSRPIAAAINGAIADQIGLGAAFTLVAALVAVLAWRARPSVLASKLPPS